MLIELRAKNCFSFSDEIRFSTKADMRNKKFSSNVHTENHFNVLKTVGIYGPNNAGKTCLIKCIRSAQNILLNQKPGIMPNIFQESTICQLGITFLEEGREFSYDFWYDDKKKEYPYERFAEITKDQYGNEKENVWLLKDIINGNCHYNDENLLKMMPLISQSNLLFYLVDSDKFRQLAEIKRIVTKFASGIDIVNMNNIPLKRTINLMKTTMIFREKSWSSSRIPIFIWTILNMWIWIRFM
ncbi:hypothetical protein C823_007332 [Eubacterium plexicaudatum ASF492]|nr:hypothetical protein C823_007332 [Eubacterium plexicaudatum ASF492]